jgi:hypothetical protein
MALIFIPPEMQIPKNNNNAIVMPSFFPFDKIPKNPHFLYLMGGLKIGV